MGLFSFKHEPSPAQLVRLRGKPVFSFTKEETEIQEAEPEVDERTELEIHMEFAEPEQVLNSMPTEETPFPQPEVPSDTASLTPQFDPKALQLLEQLQQDIKLIRREQEYLLNVTESSQAFLETLSRELISILRIIDKGEPPNSNEVESTPKL